MPLDRSSLLRLGQFKGYEFARCGVPVIVVDWL